MSEPKLGVVAVGNALVDVIAQTSEEFIADQNKNHGMEKGAMTLIDETRAVELYSAMSDGTETSGGSAANTMAGFASFGGKGGFIGKVASDELGKVFQNDIRNQGLQFDTQPIAIGAHTGRCMILVTPDAQRTMNTFLGASVELSPVDVDEIEVNSISYNIYASGDAMDICGMSHQLSGFVGNGTTGMWAFVSNPGSTAMLDDPNSATPTITFSGAIPQTAADYVLRWKATSGSCAGTYDDVYVGFSPDADLDMVQDCNDSRTNDS